MGSSFSSPGYLRRTTPNARSNNSTSHPTEENIHDLHPEPASVARYTERTSHLFALIIGIDTYVGKPLRGAVADAKEMKIYLQETLGVSEEYIRILLDDQATRNEIIAAFRAIRDDRRIRNGDPILIFFAGHGTELEAPKAWRIENMNHKIQGLLPHDYKQRGTHPIPDRTIGALIEDIAREKGNNITVIFDCCYAAGVTRADDKDMEYVPRSAENIDPNILLDIDDLDQEVFTGRHGDAPKGFGTHGIESHVLLAACRTTELAYEHRGRGLFTSELLKILRGSAANHLTYAEVFNRIHLDRQDQHPSCQGIHGRRVLFDKRLTDDGPTRYPINVDHNNIVVGAGKAHGVSHGVEFTLYSERGERLDMIKVDDSATIQDFKTIVRKHPPENVSFAKLTRVGKVSIYVAPERNSSPSLKRKLQRMCQSNDVNFQLVEDPGQAKLEVAMENGGVCFKILDQRTKRFGLTRLPFTATVETVHHVLSAAAHYYWYLHHTNGSVNTNLNMDVNFYELGSELDDDMLPHKIPVGQGLCRKDPVDNSDVISFVVAREKEYGIEIRNNTRRDLYVNAFLFNGSSLRIAPYRIQSIVGNPEAPLKQKGIKQKWMKQRWMKPRWMEQKGMEQKGMLTIGYGPGNTDRPFTYWVGGGQNVDVGYLKLFFATRPIDLSSIIQGSPFQPVNNEQSLSRPFGDAREGDVVTDEREVEDMWFTKVIPIVQRRA